VDANVQERTALGGLMNLVRMLRILVAAEIGLVLANIASAFLLKDSLPEILQQYLMSEAARTSTAFDYLKSAIFLPAFVLLISGWIGLWKLKPWARFAYPLSWILSVLSVPMFGPAVMHGIEFMFDDLATLAAGMTLALIWFSPLALHFGRKPNPSTAG
jgi:hypothetical protein